jgi:phenylpropionate dioxygenase-like ring-hydroxylating dioxygenase large terminal subunit
MIIPSIYYSNNYSFDEEINNVFRENWLFFGFVSEFENKNIIAKNIAGLPIFLFKDSNYFKGYFNICPHRGAALVRNDSFLGTHNTILCPYHNWSFDLDSGNSKNVKISNLVDPKCTHLNNFKVDTVGNFIFIKLSSNSSLGLKEFLGSEILFELSVASDLLNFSNISSKEILHDCNWKHIVENVIDNKHCGPVHKNTLAKIGFCKNKPLTELYGLHSQFTIDPGSPESARKRKRLLIKIYKEDCLVDFYKHILIFPNLTISIFEGVHYTIGYINPKSNLKTNYETHYLRPSIEDANISDVIENSHVHTALEIFAEDVNMLNSLSDNLNKIGLRGELYSDELRIIHFMKTYLKLINK